MKNNVKTIKTSKLAIYRKAVITSSLVAAMVAASTINALAAPAGVDTSSMNTMIDIIFWVIGIAIAGCSVVPGLYHIAQGVSNEDNRTRNGGIATAIVGVACIAALPVVKTLLF